MPLDLWIIDFFDERPEHVYTGAGPASCPNVVCRHGWFPCSMGVSVVTVKAEARSGSMGRIS